MVNALKQFIKRYLSKTVNIGGMRIAAPYDHVIDVHLQRYPFYNRRLSEIAHEPAHKVILDIGANIGDTLALMYKKDAEYHCVEPNERFFRYLVKNTAGLKNVHLYRYALSSFASEIKGTFKEYDGTARLTDGDLQIQTSTLDALFFDRLPRIDYIKIDCDGYDQKIIWGGENILKRDHPVLFFEYTKKPFGDIYGPDFLVQLSALGYRVFRYYDNVGTFIIQVNEPNRGTFQYLHNTMSRYYDIEARVAD